MDTRTVVINNVSLDALKDLAHKLSLKISPGITICLWGDLGAGKTTFSRFLLQALDPDIDHVPSPTFTLVQDYKTPQGNIWHCDLYRLKSSDEILELGIEEAIYESIVLIEWPQKMGAYLPYDRLDCFLTKGEDTIDGEGTRNIKFQSHGDCHINLHDLLK